MLLTAAFLIVSINSSGQHTSVLSQDDFLLSFADSVQDECGYKNVNGEVIIPLGKYLACSTDTFRNYAIVAVPRKGFVAIDRNENIIYDVFPFDNGPDYVSEGLFRIVKDQRIGFANAKTGEIVIEPTFKCAFPFEGGKAKVSFHCKVVHDGEHSRWVSNHWFYINVRGIKVK